ncbi:MAG: response regulator [Elainella sp. C42_A2020_010]|nr:response regulator [Elainella sp. C42_A2020_010]RNJ67187.1 MAG: response regulator [Leptolyngbya sp. IPPAS B-1204]
MKVLLVEDDECTAKTLETALARENYAIDVAGDGELGWRLIEAFAYDLILLDVILPKLDGISLCRQIRQHNYKTPVLLLTAQNSSTDRIAGLDAGADDYVVKPFELPELLARVRVLLRRGSSFVLPVLEWDHLRLDLAACQVTYGDQLLQLTPKEYRMLELFLRHPQRVFARSSILEHLWGSEEMPGEDTVTSHIKGLRQKLKQAGAPFNFIETVYGMGYRLRQSKSEPSQSVPEDSQAAGQKQAPIILNGNGLNKNGSNKNGSSKNGLNKNGLNKNSLNQVDTAGNTNQSTDQALANPTQMQQDLETGRQKQQIQVGLQQLWSKYAEHNFNRLRLIEQAIEALQTGELSAALHHQAYVAAHQLAGAMGIFQRLHGSHLAAQLEQVFKSDQLTLRENHAALIAIIAELRQVLQAGAPLPEVGTTSLLLVIDHDPTLLEQVRQSGQAIVLQPSDLAAVADSTHLAKLAPSDQPATFVVNLCLADNLAAHLAAFRQLTHQLPPTSILLFTDQVDLNLRVQFTQAGVHAVLPKSLVGQILSLAGQPAAQPSIPWQVLMVDDDPQILAAMQTWLSPWNIHLTALEHAKQLWQTLQTCDPDLLILDVEMPQINGIELCRAIRSEPRWQQLPIVFLTVHRDSETLRQMLEVGANALINKPIGESSALLPILTQIKRAQVMRVMQ